MKNELELRDYFAARAMDIVLSETVDMVPASYWDWVKSVLHEYAGLTWISYEMIKVPNVYEHASVRCYEYADAMLEARKRKISSEKS